MIARSFSIAQRATAGIIDTTGVLGREFNTASFLHDCGAMNCSAYAQRA
jgi:hypothetical protein